MIVSKQVEEFIRIAETGSFSQAARELYISQPALTRQIAMLEQNLGFKLFERSHRGAELTAAGKCFYGAMKRVMQISGEALERGRLLARAERPTLKIGAVSVAEASVLNDHIMGFIGLHPEVETSLIMLPFALEVRERAVLSGQIDLFYGEYQASREKRGLGFTALAPQRACLVMSKKHPLAGRECLKPEDLTGYRIFIPYYGSESPALIVQASIAEKNPLVDFEIRPTEERDAILIQTTKALMLMPESVAANIPNSAFAHLAGVEGTEVRSGLIHSPVPGRIAAEFLKYVSP